MKKLFSRGFAIMLALGAALGVTGCKKKPKPGGIVFFGASITQDWKLGKAFPDAPVINKGVGGQYVEAMQKRFKKDVLDVKPKAVIIKPCAINFGPLAEGPEATQRRIAEMAAQAEAAGIKVAVGTIIPSTKQWAIKKDSEWPAEHKWEVQPGVIATNAFIKKLAAEKGYELVDYYQALSDAEGFADTTLFKDGLHPNEQGYQRMKAAVTPVVQKFAALPYPPAGGGSASK